jgi:hypothetical protein
MVPMVTVVPAMPVAVPADAAQAVIGPHQPATRMIIIGVVVVGIIRVIAAADKEVAMMVEATVMETGEACSAAVPSASTAMERMKAATMEASPTAAMKTTPMEATAAMETTTPMKAAAMSATAAAAADFGHQPVGCVLGRHGLRCDERRRSRGPVRCRNQNQHRRCKGEKAEPSICNRPICNRPMCNRRHACFSLQAGERQRSATSIKNMIDQDMARFSPADLRDYPEY